MMAREKKSNSISSLLFQPHLPSELPILDYISLAKHSIESGCGFFCVGRLIWSSAAFSSIHPSLFFTSSHSLPPLFHF